MSRSSFGNVTMPSRLGVASCTTTKLRFAVIDTFVVAAATIRILYALVVLGHNRRNTAGPNRLPDVAVRHAAVPIPPHRDGKKTHGRAPAENATELRNTFLPNADAS